MALRLKRCAVVVSTQLGVAKLINNAGPSCEQLKSHSKVTKRIKIAVRRCEELEIAGSSCEQQQNPPEAVTSHAPSSLPVFSAEILFPGIQQLQRQPAASPATYRSRDLTGRFFFSLINLITMIWATKIHKINFIFYSRPNANPVFAN